MTKPTPIIDAATRAVCRRLSGTLIKEMVDCAEYPACCPGLMRCKPACAALDALCLACPKEPPAEWIEEMRETLFIRHVYLGYDKATLDRERERMRRLDEGDAIAVYKAQPLWRELWADDQPG
jgi:hypothetical protein